MVNSELISRANRARESIDNLRKELSDAIAGFNALGSEYLKSKLGVDVGDLIVCDKGKRDGVYPVYQVVSVAPTYESWLTGASQDRIPYYILKARRLVGKYLVPSDTITEISDIYLWVKVTNGNIDAATEDLKKQLKVRR